MAKKAAIGVGGRRSRKQTQLGVGATWWRRGVGVDERYSHQDKFVTTITTDGDEIANNLPEVGSRIVSPLFELFEFFEIPKSLPAEEVARLVGGRT